MRNRRIRSKMNVWLPKTVIEFYTLVDKCANIEDGRRLLGEEDGVVVDSEDDDDTTNQKKKNNNKRNKNARIKP